MRAPTEQRHGCRASASRMLADLESRVAPDRVCPKLASAPLELLPPRRVRRSRAFVAGRRLEISPSYDYLPADPVDPIEGGSANDCSWSVGVTGEN